MSRQNSTRQPRPNRRYRRLVPTAAIAATLMGAGGFGGTADAATHDAHLRKPPAPSALTSGAASDAQARTARTEGS